MISFIKQKTKRHKLKKEIREHIHRPLDIHEILSRNDNSNVVVDAYEFFMRKNEWDISHEMNETVRTFLYSVLYDGEVGNGGVSFFLCESAGEYAHEVADALHSIGALESEQFLRKAIGFFPNGIVPKDEATRNTIISEMPENAFDEIDMQAYDEDISTYCLHYLRDNKNAFIE